MRKELTETEVITTVKEIRSQAQGIGAYKLFLMLQELYRSCDLKPKWTQFTSRLRDSSTNHPSQHKFPVATHQSDMIHTPLPVVMVRQMLPMSRLDWLRVFHTSVVSSLYILLKPKHIQCQPSTNSINTHNQQHTQRHRR